MLSVPMAVVDCETTGLHPGYHHRVVEIAIVQIDPDGGRSAWSTLVDPERDLGPQGLHGSRGADLLEAPCFADVAGDVCALLDGRLPVAHNAGFDRLFVEHEMQRAGVTAPDGPWLCTMHLSQRAGLGSSLAACCAAAGVENVCAHSALDDANATAHLLQALLQDRAVARHPGVTVAGGTSFTTMPGANRGEQTPGTERLGAACARGRRERRSPA